MLTGNVSTARSGGDCASGFMIAGFPIIAKSFMYLSDAGIWIVGGEEGAVDGLEFVPAGSNLDGGEFVGWVPGIGGLLTRLECHGNVIVKEMFFFPSFD